MSPLDDVHRSFRNEGRRGFGPNRNCLILSGNSGFERKLDDAMFEALLRRELQLELLLACHGLHCAVHSQHLMIPPNHLPGSSGLTLIEQDEVLEDVQEPVMRQHAVQQHLGVHAALVRLVEPLPLSEVLHPLVIEP